MIERKLEALRQSVQRVRLRRPASAAALIADADAQDVLVLNLSRAVQICVDIGAHLLASSPRPAPTTMGETFDALAASGVIDSGLAGRLRRAVGFRNLAVHNYEVIDWQIVFGLSGAPVTDFEDFARAVVKLLESPPC